VSAAAARHDLSNSWSDFPCMAKAAFMEQDLVEFLLVSNQAFISAGAAAGLSGVLWACRVCRVCRAIFLFRGANTF
jgi:hypothetical protein